MMGDANDDYDSNTPQHKLFTSIMQEQHCQL
jgi:hypothetical protein